MTIKSLLLGSTAALMAVTTAQAADAIVVEPEPVDYVRVCDAYGSGFFFIPGTETCMRISGYVRTTYSSEHRDIDVDVTPGFAGFNTREFADFKGGVDDAALLTSIDGDNDRHRWNYRGRLNIDVRNETEWGTLRSQLRLQGGDTNEQDANVAIDRALISLAGFNLGYSDNYWTTNHGYGAGTPAINDGFYNYDQAIFFDYTWAQDGLAITVGVQDSSSNGGSFDGTYGAAYADFYAGLNYSADWGSFAFTALHDSNSDDGWVSEGNFDRNEGQWLYKASVQFDLSEFIPGGQFGAWYAAADRENSRYVTGAGLSAGILGFNNIQSEWGVQLKGKLAENLTGYVLYSAASGSSDFDAFGGSGNDFEIDSDESVITAGLVWAPVTGLTIQAEYSALTSDHEIDLENSVNSADVDLSADAFIVRVTRSW